jgi:hypothetical protein
MAYVERSSGGGIRTRCHGRQSSQASIPPAGSQAHARVIPPASLPASEEFEAIKGLVVDHLRKKITEKNRLIRRLRGHFSTRVSREGGLEKYIGQQGTLLCCR